MTDVTLTVAPDARAAPARLDVFVHAALPGLSRRLVHRLIREGGVRVNGRRTTKGTRVRAGDVVTVPALPASIAPEPGLGGRGPGARTRSVVGRGAEQCQLQGVAEREPARLDDVL